MAAVLACAEGAVLSGPAAACHYGITKGGPPVPEVTTPKDRRIPSVMSHRIRLAPRDVTAYRRIPITTVPRTLVDIAGRFDFDDLAEICHVAEVRHGVRAPAVYAALARRRNAPGAGRLHNIFSREARTTLSKLEREFLALLRSAGLPLPRTNRPAGGR
jgi:hypothetical protein